jgi:hypothetical protein
MRLRDFYSMLGEQEFIEIRNILVNIDALARRKEGNNDFRK